MGAIIARFRRKESTRDTLERIQKDLDSIEDFKRSTQASHKKVIGYLLTYFSVLYFLAAAFAYFKFFYHPEWQDWKSQLQLYLPFLVAPLLFLIVKNVLTWFYHRKIRRNEAKAEKLKKEKADILEKVMETETYRVAKEILEKFGNEPSTGRPGMMVGTPGPNTSVSRLSGTPNRPQLPGNELRRRHTAAPATAAATPPAASAPARPQLQPSAKPMNLSFAGDVTNASMTSQIGDTDVRNASPVPGQRPTMPGGHLQRRPPGPPLPRPVLPRERGYMDRVVEYLVGDGPSNRFALICRQCQSHNGMALRDEFEYIAYRCCYCFYWNPARKQRPVAPKLTNQLQKQSSTESTSEDEDDSSRRSRSPQPSAKSTKPVNEPQPEPPKPEATNSQEDLAEDETEDSTEVTPMETSDITSTSDNKTPEPES